MTDASFQSAHTLTDADNRANTVRWYRIVKALQIAHGNL